MRRSPGKFTEEVTAILAEQARLRVLTKTIKELTHVTGLARSTVQSHLARLAAREGQNVVSHGTKDHSHS